MSTIFHVPKDNASSTVTTARNSGDPIIVLDGTKFGSSFPIIISIARQAGQVFTDICTLEVTGISSNTLTVSGPLDGTTDANLLVGDLVEMRPTALAITEIQDAVHTLEATQSTNTATLSGHVANVSNPHQVNKSQVGLGSVDNTSDAAKPISTPTAVALAGKAATVHTHAAGDIVSGVVDTARLGGGAADATKFLRGDQTWQAVSNPSVFVASGASHSTGLVPDPGSTAGTTRFLREDASFAVPPGSPPGGSSGQLQYNNGTGGFAGSAGLAFDGTKLTVAGPTQSTAPSTGADFIGYEIVSDAGNLCLAFRTKVDPSVGYSKVSFCDPTNGVEYGSLGFRSLDPNLYIGSGLSVQGLVTALGGLQVYNNAQLQLTGALSAVGGFDVNIQPPTGQSIVMRAPNGAPVLTVAPDGSMSGDASGLTVYQQINNQSGTTYTPVLADKGKCLAFSSATAVTLTIPPHSSVAFPVGVEIGLIQLGAGQVTITAGAGVTLLPYSGEVVTAGTNAYAVIKQVATDQWVPMGKLS